MWNNVTLGRYLPGDSILHRLHPVSKITALFLSMLVVLLLPGLGGLLVAIIYTVALLWPVRSMWTYLLGGLKPLLLIIGITFIFHIFSVPGGETLLSIGKLQITVQGLLRAVSISGRLVLVVILASVLTLTTTPMAITHGLERLFSPLKKIGLPAHELAMMISIALRFVPMLFAEAEIIMRAQRSRGTVFNQGGLIKRSKALLSLFIPLLAAAFRRAEELAIAMEARGYRGGTHRTSMTQWPVGKEDYLLVTSSLIVMVITLFQRIGW